MNHSIISFLAFAMAMLCCCPAAMAGDTEKTITVNGEARQYIIHVPENVGTNAPLVFSLHGTSNSMRNKHPFSSEVADKHGCIVVYPQGKELYFPVFGGNATGWHSTGETSEDIDFFKAIIDEVAAQHSIDRKRIYCCGFSNGGMMTYTVANVASDIFAAFASVSGYPINEFHLHTTSARPFPFLHIHGKADDFVRYAHMPKIVDNIVARNGCNPVPVKSGVAGKYDKSVYAAAKGSFPYIYYEVDGMGHNDWTANTEDGNSAETIWKFFSQYSLDTERDETLKWQPNIATQGWNPAAHGWTVNSGTTLLRFGGEQNTNDNQNAYHSLQLEKGLYALSLSTEGSAGKTVGVKLQAIAGSKAVVLNETVAVGEDKVLYFAVDDDWNEYQLTITRASSSDAITVKNIEIHSVDEIPGEEVEIPQDQGKTLDNFTRTDLVEGNDYNTYTAHGDLNIAIKMQNIDVAGYDYVCIRFAEPVKSGWKLAFWSNQDLVDVPSGATEYKYVFADDPKCDVKNGILPQICLMTFYGAPNPLEAKVTEIVKGKNPVQNTPGTDGEPTYTKVAADTETFALSKRNGNEWAFSSPVDISAYKYMIVTTVQSAGGAGLNGFMILTDNTGKRAGNNWASDLEINYDASAAGTRGGMWLDRWNNQHCACINLDYLRKQGLDTKAIRKFSVPVGDNIASITLTNYAEGNAVKSTEGWGSCSGDYVRENTLLTEGKYGTICLRYNAAVSGARLYSVDEYVAGSHIVLSEEPGIVKKGTPYFYLACDFKGHNADGDNAGTNSNVNFYRLDATDDFADDNTPDAVGNGLVGLYIDNPWYVGAGFINGSFILSNNLLHEIDSAIDITANHCFFDPGKYRGVQGGAGAKVRMGAHSGETAIKGVQSALTSGKIYDMNGREVKHMEKGGMYIVGGMKVIVK